MKSLKIIFLFLLGIILFNCSSSDPKPEVEPDPDSEVEPVPDPDPVPELPAVKLTIDGIEKFQTIDGFGFFGAKDVWWHSSDNMWDEQWGTKVIEDLGVTIWRNEYYPPATPAVGQDADWNKQKPVVAGLKKIADANNVDLKFLFTVWSPPADMKWAASLTWAGDEEAVREPGDVSTKNGGTLSPEKYDEYATWLNAGVDLYKDLGVDLYAISLQNEPLFSQSFNSCTYTSAWYNQLLTNVVPGIKSENPDLKIFGSENMLVMEGREDNLPWFYHSGIKGDPEATENIDILAVHGYSDGVAASSGSALGKMWTNHLNELAEPMGKPIWMTETSGYSEDWNKTNDTPGAFNLAMDMFSGLVYGNISAWVWWQGSQLDGIGNYNLMKGIETGKKYAVSKHYYRYLRPGAVRIQSSSDDEDILVTAFEHQSNGTSTVIVINSSSEDKQVSFNGNGVSSSYVMYRTNAEDENCKEIEEVESGDDNGFVLPANSIVTLQAGGDKL